MKYLLIASAFFAANAMACPADGAKDAMAPTSQPTVAAKAKPAAAVNTARASKAQTKVAVKSATEPRKSASL